MVSRFCYSPLLLMGLAGFAPTVASASVWVEGSTTGSFSNATGGRITDGGTSFEFGGFARPSSLEVNPSSGTIDFSGYTSFEATVGTLQWENNFNLGDVFQTSPRVDVDWNLSITKPVDGTETFGGRLKISNLRFFRDDKIRSLLIGELAGQSYEFKNGEDTLSVTLLTPTVTGGSSQEAARVVGNKWINPEGGVSTLEIKALFGYQSGSSASVQAPTPASLGIFCATGMMMAVGVRRGRKQRRRPFDAK